MKPILILNWKNYVKTSKEAVELAEALPNSPPYTLIVCPSTLHTEIVHSILTSKGVLLGSQDIATQDALAQTGRHSGAQLRSVGVSHTLVGHPETRRLGVTDKLVAQKIQQAHTHNIVPVICFTKLEQVTTLYTMLKDEPTSIDTIQSILAYEPEEYIGKKEAMPTDLLSTFFDRAKSHLKTLNINSPLLYGGSVNKTNAQDILRVGVDGFLVGGASVDRKRLKALLEVV